MRLERILLRIESWAAALCLSLILLLSLFEIAARNFFHTGLPNASVVIQYLVLWVAFLGAVLAVGERHIKIDVATLLINQAWRKKLAAPIYFFSAVISAIFFWAAARFWYGEWQAALPDERWVAGMALVFPLAFFLLSVHFALRGINGPHATKVPA